MKLLWLIIISLGMVLTSFSQANKSSNVLFPVQIQGKYGYIDSTGKIVIQPKFDSAKKFHDGLALVTIEARNIEIEKDLPPIKMGGKEGFIDKKGNFIIAPGKYRFVGNFSEGLASVWIDSPCDRSCYGYIDTTGKIVIPQQFQTAGTFQNGTVDVRMPDDRWGVIDKNGKFIIPPKYDGVFPFTEGVGIALTIKNKKSSPFDQNITDFDADFYDMDGNLTAKPQYFIFGWFENGLVQFIAENGKGFIDKQGKVAIEPKFERTMGFSEGLSAVRVNKKWGDIDPKGKFVIEPQFTEAYRFSEGLAQVRVNNNLGFIDKTGKMVIEPKSWDVGMFEDGLAFFRQENFSGYIDKTGKIIWKGKDE